MINPDLSAYDGTRSKNDSIMSGFNQRMVNTLAPRVPKWLQTYHLTAFTFFWAGLCLISGYFGQFNPGWLWGMVVGIFGHYVTDALDGEIGRRRNTGLVRWGFYVDHFADYVFLICIMIGLTYVTPPNLIRWSIVLFAVWSTFFLNAYFIWIIRRQYTLSFFRFSSIEAQFMIGFLVISLTIGGPAAMGKVLYVLVPTSILGLIILFYRTQHQLWHQDLQSKTDPK